MSTDELEVWVRVYVATIGLGRSLNDRSATALAEADRAVAAFKKRFGDDGSNPFRMPANPR